MMGAAQIVGAASAAPTFDPAAWLESFEAVGGLYWFGDEGLSFAWAVDGYTDTENRAAAELYREMVGEARSAVFDLLIGREAARHGN